MEASFLERLNWRSNPFAGWFPPWCDRPLCDCGDGCILKSSLMIQTRGRRFFQCANFDQTYRPMCNFIEWVDMENPQNNGTRAYPRSETRSDYLRRKDEHERRIAAEALEWQVNPLGLPTWRERPECRCGDRCQVIRSGNPRMCGLTRWIDNVTPSYHGQKITESETQVEYQRLKDHENAMHSDRPRRGR
uniref:GRF-type domain-containing protein n=1 Tax=Oryza glaberrima TaxID=4538 RepID=I1NVQ6_ORYGL